MQTLVGYVENKPGVLNRVASLARRLAINIDSLTVGPTENEAIARMTIVAHTDERGAHRLEASLEKLVDVLLAENISTRALLERDLALIKEAHEWRYFPQGGHRRAFQDWLRGDAHLFHRYAPQWSCGRLLHSRLARP